LLSFLRGDSRRRNRQDGGGAAEKKRLAQKADH
jgi:hypothetical protein